MDSIIKKLAVTAVLSAFLMSCSQMTEDEYLAKAKSNDDVQTKIVVLKNAAQTYPKDSRIRAELGKALLQNGNLDAAIKEVSLSIEINPQQQDALISVLYESFTLARMNEDAILFAQENDITGCSSCQLSLVWARINSGEGMTLVELTGQPTEQELGLFSLLKSLNNRTSKVGKEALIKIVNNPDTNISSHKLIASEIALRLGMNDVALKGFTSVLKEKPANVWLNLPIAQSFIALNKFDESIPHINKILTINKNNGLANFLNSLVYMSKLDYESAVLYGSRAHDYGYETAQTKLILGLSQYRTQRFEAALNNFESAASSLPKKHFVKQMIIATRIKLGDDEAAALELANKEEINAADVLLMGQSLASLNYESDKMVNLLNSTLESQNNLDPAIESEIFLINLIQGKVPNTAKLDEAINEEAVDKTMTSALTLYFIRNQEYLKAEQQLKRYLAIKSDDIEFTNLLGAILTGQGKTDEAAKIYEKASQISKNNAPSMYFDILKASESGDLSLAIRKAEALLDAHPLHLGGLKLLTIMSSNQQLSNDASIRYAQKAVEIDGSNISHKLILANLYVDEGSASLAQKILNSIDTSEAQQNKQYWEVNHYLASALGSEKDVEKNFESWRKAMPNDLASVFRYTNHLVSKRKYTEAARLLSTVPNSHPEASAVRASEFYILLKAKDIRRAKAVYGQIEKLNDTPAKHLYTAMLTQAEGNNTDALTHLQQFYEQSQSEESALMLVEYRRAMKMDYIDILKQHESKYPEDARILSLLAENLIGKDNNKAAEYYSRYVARVKNDPIVMNNYAWVLQQIGELTLASETAKRAVNLSPNNLDFKDTYASILIETKAYDEVIEILSPVASESIDLSLKLTEALVRSGDSDAANRLLDNLSNMSMSAEQKRKYEELKNNLD
ncbi:MAG: putative PEP-CTERM system TPR-repeat lipoprotein [Glaciecola sp.]|jgi:putative PEP-CTERM system TPR-repeat lipoprotein